MMPPNKNIWVTKAHAYWSALERRFVPAYAWKSNPLSFWRERILFVMCFTAAILGPFALLPALYMSFKEGLWIVAIADTTAYVGTLSILFNGHLPLTLRGGFACFILYTLGVLLCFVMGPTGAGYIWLFGASVMITAMLGLAAAFWMLLVNAATLLAVAFFVIYGQPNWAVQMENPLQKWLVVCIIFLFFNAYVTIAVGIILDGLKEALVKERKVAVSLRRSQAHLQGAHERFLTVLNSLDAFIHVSDIKSNEILFMNQALIRHLGKDITGGLCWRDLRMQSSPCEACRSQKLIDAQGMPTGVHTWEEHMPGPAKWYINHDRAIQWTDGRMAKLEISTDVTELKKLERDLRQSQKMEAIGTLAGGIAHDFNNILSSIIGFTELATEDADKGSILEDNLQEVLTASKRAKDLVRHILTFARQSDKEVKPIQISTIVKEVLKLLRSAIPSSIKIQSDIRSESLVLGNPIEVHQILMNLCTNAAHAMANTTGSLSISLVDEEILPQVPPPVADLAPGSYLRLSVADSGCGIDPAHIQSIFEPYFTTKPHGDGTGIGLAVVHGIVASYQGKISVASTPGQGTRFDIYLPVVKKRVQTETATTEDVPTGTENILIVDDELAIIKMTERTLTKLGYRITARTSSIEALELFQKRPEAFDLVITDVAMPNMTGETLAGEMLRIRPDTPIILCTGYSKNISQDALETIGVKALMHKPVVQVELAKTIRNILSDHSKTGIGPINPT